MISLVVERNKHEKESNIKRKFMMPLTIVMNSGRMLVEMEREK